MYKFRILLWDLDGTVNDFSSTENYAVKKGFERLKLGVCTDEMVARYSEINVGYWEKLERGEMAKSEILVNRFRDFFTEYGISPEYAEVFNENYQIDLGDNFVPVRNSLEVLQKIKETGNFRQFVVTNGLAINQKRKLSKPPLSDFYEYAFISDEIGFEKPSIQFFNVVFEKLGEVKKDEILIIGDSLTSDIRGGNNAGIKTCWFNPRGKQNNKGVHVDYEIKELSELLRIL